MPYLVDELNAAAYMLAQFLGDPTQSEKKSPASPRPSANHNALANVR
jgi:hypothetical protein